MVPRSSLFALALPPALARVGADAGAAPAANQQREARAGYAGAQRVGDPHSGTFGGQRMNYAATAGETFLRAADGTPRAAIFSTSYVKEPRDPNRPVTFLFNGGPGSGSYGSTWGVRAEARRHPFGCHRR
jgi:carboxypeptidase C (cathepsin A)